MLDRIDALEQRVRELQAKMIEVTDSLREMAEARAAATMLDRSEDEARTSPPDRRK